VKLFLILLTTVPITSWAQPKTATADASGSCSTAIVGNSNQITVTCYGLPKEKLAELSRLMNGILSRQLDPKKVYGELDLIYGALSNLNAAISPLADAPPEVTARMKRAQRLGMECSGLASDWNGDLQDTAKNSGKKSMQTITDQLTVLQSGYESVHGDPARDRQYSTEYATNLAPQLIAWRTRALSQLPYLRSSQKWNEANDLAQLRFVCTSFQMLATQYSVSPRADYTLAKESQTLRNSCNSLMTNWLKDDMSYGHDGTEPASPDKVNADKAAQYKDDLEGRLNSWRDEVMSEISSRVPKKNYDAVSDAMQLLGVCADFGQVVAAYQSKVAEDIRKSKASSAHKK